MVGVFVLFVVQVFLFGLTKAQCNATCSACKNISSPADPQYIGTWNLVDPLSSRCPSNVSCLYGRECDGQEMCFCDPGNITYEICPSNGVCKTTVTRVNARELDTLTIKEYNDTLRAVKLGSNMQNCLKFDSIGSYHGRPYMCNYDKTGPPGTSSDVNYCCIPHNKPGDVPVPGRRVLFTAWHRLLVVQMEKSLQGASLYHGYPLFAMPYWDWTIPRSAGQSDIPELANQGPWLNGPIPPNAGTGRTVTQRNLQPLNYPQLISQVSVAYSETRFRDFNYQIIWPHNEIHRDVGGDMGTVDTAAFDPIFYLHHSYVDYQYAYFQELQRLRGHPVTSNSFGRYATFKMQPFDRDSNPIPVTRTHSEGPQGLDYETTFCYKYDELLFQGQTPLQFINSEKEESKLPHLYAGSFLKQTGITSRVSFALLHNDTKTPAGSLSTFGSSNQDPNFSASAPNHVILYDVTELAKNISLNMQDNYLKFTVSNYTDAMGNNLPINETYQPIVIYQEPNAESYIFRLHVDQVHEYAPVMYGRIGHHVEFLKNGEVVSGDDDVKTWVGGTDDDSEEGKPVEGRVAIEYQEHRFIIQNEHGQINITIGYDLDSFECDNENFPVSVDPGIDIIPWNLDWLKENPVVNVTNCPGIYTIIASCDRTLSTVKKVDKNDFDDCTNLWTKGTPGIYGLLVDTSNPGTYYFADGKKTGNQNYCNLGWKIAINVVEC